MGSCTIDTKIHKRRCPSAIPFAPDVCVSVLGAGYNSIRLCSPVYSSNEFIVLCQDGVSGPRSIAKRQNMDLVVVWAHCYPGSICIEGMDCYWSAFVKANKPMKELENVGHFRQGFWSIHLRFFEMT